MIAKLQEVEDWLYEDGEDEAKGVYISKLEELKKVFLYALNYSTAWSTMPTETSLLACLWIR